MEEYKKAPAAWLDNRPEFQWHYDTFQKQGVRMTFPAGYYCDHPECVSKCHFCFATHSHDMSNLTKAIYSACPTGVPYTVGMLQALREGMNLVEQETMRMLDENREKIAALGQHKAERSRALVSVNELTMLVRRLPNSEAFRSFISGAVNRIVAEAVVR